MIPLLFQQGDCIFQDEFVALWEKMPDLKFAELIHDVVYMPGLIGYEQGLRRAQIRGLLGLIAHAPASAPPFLTRDG